MGIEHTGAPTFSISGSPSAIREKATTMRSRANQYQILSQSLSSLSTDGWTGRAADRFHEKFSVEPGRWQQAATGFTNAADALDLYATSLENAQTTASDCKTNYDEANRITKEAREEYDADVERGKQEKREWEQVNGPGTYNLTIEPFSDPGESMRNQAVSDFDSAVSTLETEAETCASTIRASCEGAPEKRNWLETGVAAVGEVLYGAFEACLDVGKLLLDLNGISLLFDDLIPFLTGELTAEELAMKFQLRGESVVAFGKALWENPLEVGKEIAKGVLDWDTWADNPARAVGHLVPDIVVAVATAGGGTAATKSSSILAKLGTHADDLADVGHAARGVDDAAAGVKRLDKLDLKGVGKAPNDFRIAAKQEGLTREEWEGRVDDWVGRVADANPGLPDDSIRALHRYSIREGYQAMNGGIRSGSVTPEVQKLIDDAADGLDRLPSHQPTDLYRGTGVPKEVIETMLKEKSFSDPAFLSTTRKPSFAESSLSRALRGSPDDVPVQFRIKDSTAPTIDPFSAYRGQAEHVFKPGTEFDILDMVKKDFGGREGWEVTMKER